MTPSTEPAEPRTLGLMTIGSMEGTLTRQYQIRDIVVALGDVPSGAPLDDVQAALDELHGAHAGLANRLFDHDATRHTIESEMHRACRDSRSDARLLVWANLLVADHRMADVVETFLTHTDGSVREEAFNATDVRSELERRDIGSAQKAASNLLRYFETAGIVESTRHGSTIVGIDRLLNTLHAVAGLVSLAAERAEHLEGLTVSIANRVDFALDRGVNHWVLLTADQFRAAAIPRAPGGATGTAETGSAGAPSDGAGAGGGLGPTSRSAGWEEFKPKDVSDYLARVAARTLRKTRVHEKVVNAYAAWAEAADFQVSSPHPVDLSLISAGQRWIVEVKAVYRGDATRAVREAVGQLLEYRHFLYDDDTGVVALFSEPVGDAYVAYLEAHGLRAVWLVDDEWCGSPTARAEGLSER